LRNRRLYAGAAELDGPWVHMTNAARLSPHGESYASTAVGHLSVLARDVMWIRWCDELEAAA